MFQSIQKIYNVLLPEHRSRAVWLLIVIFLGMGVEAVSIGMVIPALSLFSGGGTSQSESLSQAIIQFVKSISGDQEVLFMLGLLCAIFFFRSIIIVVISWVRLQFIKDIRVSTSHRLFLLYMMQDYHFHLQNSTHNLIRNVITEATKFSNLLNLSFVFLSDLLVVLVVSVLVFLIYPSESLYVLLWFGVSWLLFYYIIGKKMSLWGERRQVSDGQRLQHVQQGLNGYKDIRLLGKEVEFVEFYRPYNVVSAKMAQYNSFAKGIPRILFEMAMVLALIGIVVVESYSDPSMTFLVPKLGLFAMAAFRILPSVNRLASGYNSIKFGRAVVDITYQDLMLRKQLHEDVDGRDFESFLFQREIKLKNIDFWHDESKGKILSRANLTIKKGEMIGFVGKSGSGKSTIVNLLLGLLMQKSGSVLVDEVDIHRDLRAWHRCIGYVPQTVFLCDATLAENIAFGVSAHRIDEDRVKQVLEMANLTDFVAERSGGIQMPLGENGVKLSGGQRQRVGIARALYRNPEVLILDEVTSALDAESEQKIVLALEKMHGRKTILMISHKDTALTFCDRVFSLKEGKISEVLL